MKRIKLGRFEVISDTSRQGSIVSTPTTGRSSSAKTRMVSLQEAQQSAGFKIFQPTHLPTPELRLTKVHQLIQPLPPLTKTIFTELNYTAGAQRWVLIRQIPIGEQGTPHLTVSFNVSEGTVSDRLAAFFTFNLPNQTQPNMPSNVLGCMWEQDGFLMELQGCGFPVGDLVHIAESLA